MRWRSPKTNRLVIEQATTRTKTEILAEIETTAVADVCACANHAVIEFVGIERMTPDDTRGFTQDASDRCR
ncbi:hypothetical protein [Actinophytocola sp.]|uniref:hypothetical protein n=1 Tax=Actinophytocola sp. TaxID=1872138 RepID=UPI00389ABFB8